MRKKTRYGNSWAEELPDWAIELALYKFPKLAPHSLERWEHFVNATKILYGPDNPNAHFVWHPWAIDMIKDCCEYDLYSMAGQGSCGKSEFAGLWIIMNTLCDILRTTSIVTTTSIQSAVGKIWRSITRYYNGLPSGFKVILRMRMAPTPMIYVKYNGAILPGAGVILAPSDNKKSGEFSSKIRGIKSGGQMLFVMDEHSDIGQNFSDTALSNSKTNLFPVHIMSLSNPVSYTDPFSKLAEPVDGYNSITVDTGSWVTKMGGFCRHFDGLKNPNYLAKKNLWPVANYDVVEDAINRWGEKSAKFWRDIRGFWCPEGDTIQIYTDIEVVKYLGRETYTWASRSSSLFAGIDPAFTPGGDRCVLQPLRCANSETFVEVLDHIVIDVEAGNKDKTKTEQLATSIIRACVRLGIQPQNVGIDTGSGGGELADMIAMLWQQNELLRVSFGGKASDKPIGDLDLTPADQLYTNRVTELWYLGKELLRNKALRGIGTDLMEELCSRRYTTSRTTGNTRLTAETKKEMRSRTGKSPDIADAFAIGLETIRIRKGIKLAPTQLLNVNPDSGWGAMVRKYAELNTVNQLKTNEQHHGKLILT